MRPQAKIKYYLRCFNSCVGCSWGYLKTLSEELEVMDKSFHRALEEKRGGEGRGGEGRGGAL